jgi:hypothetical protein
LPELGLLAKAVQEFLTENERIGILQAPVRVRHNITGLVNKARSVVDWVLYALDRRLRFPLAPKHYLLQSSAAIVPARTPQEFSLMIAAVPALPPLAVLRVLAAGMRELDKKEFVIHRCAP